MAIVRPPMTSGFVADPTLEARRQEAARREANFEQSMQFLNQAFLQQNAVDYAKKQRDTRAAEGAGLLGEDADTSKLSNDLRISTAMDMTPTPGEYNYDDPDLAARAAAQMSAAGRGEGPTFMDDQKAAQDFLDQLASGLPSGFGSRTYDVGTLPNLSLGMPAAGASAPVMRGQRGGTPDLQNALLMQALSNQLGGQPNMDPRLASLMALRAIQSRGQ